jgi:quinol monooxygenase YgiN
MVHVIAKITAQPGQRDELLAEFHKLVPQVHAEAGCIEYVPAVDVASGIDAQQPIGDDSFLVIEKWESIQHLQDHLAAPHMAAYRETVRELVSSVTLNVLQNG